MMPGAKRIGQAYDRFKAVEGMLRCPVCAAPMAFANANSLTCAGNHCFDLSKYGYVNFHPKQGKTYTKELFESRRVIFRSGFYDPVKENIEATIRAHGAAPRVLLDAGCGEGFFVTGLLGDAPPHEVFGLDIVKDAIVLAAKADGSVKWLVGDLAKIPLRTCAVDVLLNIFSPANYDEFLRVLTDDGIVVKVVPGPQYLCELRACAGARLLRDAYTGGEVLRCFQENVTCLERKHLLYSVPVTPPLQTHLVRMTPMLLGVDHAAIHADDVRQITIDVEIFVGKKPKEEKHV